MEHKKISIKVEKTKHKQFIKQYKACPKQLPKSVELPRLVRDNSKPLPLKTVEIDMNSRNRYQVFKQRKLAEVP
jgi:hypothetical protein